MARFQDAGRKCQAHFRDSSPTIGEPGHSPSDEKGQRNGHLLALGHEEKNLYPSLRGEGGAKGFFKERKIPWHRTSRSGDTPKEEEPTRNMASSQVACVNFLLPLSEIPGALRAVLCAIDNDVEDVLPIHHEGRESLVELEWIGLDTSLEGVKTRGAVSTSTGRLHGGVHQIGDAARLSDRVEVR